ncbi:MAG: S4 domain-containing protein, partial [Bacilli bacterium]
MNEIKVSKEQANQRLDVFLVSLDASNSRTKYKQLIENETILVNGLKSSPNYSVKEDDIVLINPIIVEEIKVEAENIPLNIVYEDDDIIVVNKASGMVVHPGAGISS